MSKWKQNSPPDVPQQVSRESWLAERNRAGNRLVVGPGTYRQTVATRQDINAVPPAPTFQDSAFGLCDRCIFVTPALVC